MASDRSRRSARSRGSRRSGASGPASFGHHLRRLLFLGLLAVVASLAGAVHLLAKLDLPETQGQVDQTSILYDRNGVEIARFHGEENRVPLDFDEISPTLIDAVIAAEDRDFFTHPGVDPVAIARAAWSDIRSEGALQGGSTITQQYIKNVFLTPERTLSRKLKEAAFAIKLERETSKNDILEGYLNTIYFGRGAYGIEAAARAWFGVRAGALTVGQSAYLAGLIRAPESADISRLSQVDEAYRRRSTVLRAMWEEGYISQAEFDTVEATPIEGYTLPRVENSATQISDLARLAGTDYLIEEIRTHVEDRYGDQVLFRGGLRITTTIDLRLQLEANQAALSALRRDGDPTAAVLVLDELGGIRAMIGGRGFDSSHVNLALGTEGGGSGRQAGSVFKPIVLAHAVQEGVSVESRYWSPPVIDLDGLDNGNDWTVRNHLNTDYGIIDLVDATAQSANTAYAQLIRDLGPHPVVDLAKRLGVGADLLPFYSLALGAQEVSVLDMARAYSTFAGRGERREPGLVLEVLDSDGTRLERFEPVADRVMSRQEADVVTDVLTKVVEEGTGIGARVPGVPLAGKTGTTQDYRDAWFVGYSPRFTTAVWIGFPGIIKSMRDVAGVDIVTGSNVPALIWQQVMAAAHADIDPGNFVKPGPYPGTVFGVDATIPPNTTSTVPATAPITTAPAATTTAAPPPTTTTAAPTTTTTEDTTTTTTEAGGG
ncbi:MAG: transglycosylase domain-containing protein [Actinomycetota bacterium]|nr:transglycosylase domain-containing protein [Actinomycetota bacterium]